ncbi:MAG: hypothetical protein H0W83_07750 [Planctomycetes bacterium]|nr:hypothetical protein [Planctomycetota bacterium]
MPAGPWTILAVVAVVTVVVGGGAIAVGGRGASSAGSAGDAWSPPAGYQLAVQDLDSRVQNAESRTRRDPRSWLACEGLAQAYRTRAQLTGDWLDYDRARQSIARAFVIAGNGVGPFLARAQLDASLHRWNDIEADLIAADDAMPKDDERASIIGLRSERAMQSGRYDEALDGYERAAGLDHTMPRLFALADAHNSLGEHDLADRLLDEAEHLAPGRDPVACAWLQLQRGVIAQDRGQFDEAQRRYEHADAILPGWWRVEGRLADVRALSGDTDAAESAYRSLVKRTSNPEFMDALARLARRRGDQKDAARWISLAGTIYDGEFADAPEAGCGHGLEHALDLDDDTSHAITLAEMNHRLRPGGEATVKLARAYLRAGRTSEAQALVEQTLATRWDTRQLHGTAADVFTAAGDPQRALVERQRASSR